MDVLPACTMCIPGTLRGKTLYSCELSCEFQELNPGSLENVCVCFKVPFVWERRPNDRERAWHLEGPGVGKLFLLLLNLIY